MAERLLPSPPTPVSALIQNRMQELGMDREQLGFRLGYRNPAKAAGRVHVLCSGTPFSVKSRRALGRLAEALQVSPSIVSDAVGQTEDLIVARARQDEQIRQLLRERGEAEWRSTFKPHALLLTENRRPSQITLCAFTGGIDRWLIVRFDLAQSPLTFVQQVRNALPQMTVSGPDGRRSVVFFGAVNGYIVNYSSLRAVRFDLLGSPIEVLPTAYRTPRAELFSGRQDRHKLWRHHRPLIFL